MRFKVVVLGSVLTCAALASVAMTLGRARGAAWIGQPLSLVVPVQIEPGQTAASLCAEADVFHAENKLESSRVTVTAEPTAQPETFNLRITSSSPIDEPVVTVYLRAGCAQKTTRRFVLLADYPSETLPPAATGPAEAPPVKTTPAQVQDSAQQTSTGSAATVPAQGLPTNKTETKSPAKPPEKPVSGKAPALRAPAAAPTPAATKPPATTAAKSAPTPPAKGPDASRSRLKLDPLENLAERIKTLEATTSSVPLEDMVRDSQRIQQLQNDVKTLLDQAAKNEASLLLMRERLERAEAERVSSIVIWTLGALILVCLAAIAALWNRRAVATPSAWQQSIQESTHAVTPSAHDSAAVPVERPVKEPPPAEVPIASAPNSTILTPIAPVSMDVDVNLMDMDSDFSRLIAAPSGTQPMTQVMDYQPSQFSDTRTLHRDFNSDSLTDVRQQAEFFEKLGKVDQAIDVLEQRIRLNSKEAPLLYLDLLGIAHSHDLKTDFRQFRDEFEQLFNVRIPEFALFREEGRSLESHASLMQHICKLWPLASVLDVIETCVVRDPWEKNAEPFDIGAFRDLILLHGIATRLQRTQGTEQKPTDADSQHVDIDM